MAKQVCVMCHGEARVMGLGCMRESCKECNGRGYVDPEVIEFNSNTETKDKPKSSKPDKRSASYKEGVKNMMAKGMSKGEAEKLIDEEFKKVA